MSDQLELGLEHRVNPVILIAEDNDPCYTVLSSLLSRKIPKIYSPQIMQAKDGESALQTLRSRKDITHLFLDMQLPQIMGDEVAVIIRNGIMPHYTKLPLIAVTANAMPHDRELCIATGCNDYISKPIAVKELQRVIDVYFQRKIG